MSDTLVNDIDPIETQDWLSAVDSLIRAEGAERAHYIINQVIDQARNGGVNIAKGGVTTPYVNTIPVSEQLTTNPVFQLGQYRLLRYLT